MVRDPGIVPGIGRSAELPNIMELPERVRALPIDEQRGLPVPWFVAWIDGKPDFRVIGTGKIAEAIKFKRCWVCGQEIGRTGSFVIGPMCAINRTSAEPPCHRACAIYSVTACPFLTRPKMHRREGGLPDGAANPAGMMIRRNPGVALVWSTRRWHWWDAGNGPLVQIGEPEETLWFAEGRRATRPEVLESIETGLPILRAEAEKDGPDAIMLLDSFAEAAQRYLPLQ